MKNEERKMKKEENGERGTRNGGRHIILPLFTLLFSLLILLGCDNILNPHVASESGFGAVNISLGTDGTARTVLPSQLADLGALYYRLSFTRSEFEPVNAAIPYGQTSITVTMLAAGNWTLNVHGYAADPGNDPDPASALVFAAQSVNVLNAEMTPVMVNLQINEANLTQSGSGTLRYVITLPAGAAGTLELFQAVMNGGILTQGAKVGSAVILSGSTEYSDDITLDSGNYYVYISVVQSQSGSVWRELARINDGAITIMEPSFNEEDIFTQIADGKIVGFSFDGDIGFVAGVGTNAITVTVAFTQNVSALTPIISWTGAMITPQPQTADFTNPVTYIVYKHDGTINEYTVTVIPQKVKTAKPALDIDAFTYNGSPHTVILNPPNEAAYTLSGQTTETYAGNYTALVTLTDDYEWDDSTSSQLQLTWTITAAVAFNPNGGTLNGPAQVTAAGTTISEPLPPTGTATGIVPTTAGLYRGTFGVMTFVEWRKPDGTAWNFASDIVTEDITLSAHWTSADNPIDISGWGSTIIRSAFSYINYTYTDRSLPFTLVIDENIAVDTGISLSLTATDAKLTIVGIGSVREISQAEIYPLFFVGGWDGETGIELILGNNIVLAQHDDVIMMQVRENASFTMLAGSAIRGANSTDGYSQAVNLTNGNFTMHGGSIISSGASPGLAANGASTITLAGGNITGSTGDGGDVRIYDPSSSVSVSGDAHVGALTLGAYVATRAPLNINSGWTGSVGGLNLWGASTTLDGAISMWSNQQVLTGDVNATTIGQITLGNFLSFMEGDTQAISLTHEINASGVLAGTGTGTFTITNNSEWIAALASIRASFVSEFTLIIDGNVEVRGADTGMGWGFGSRTGITVTVRGTGSGAHTLQKNAAVEGPLFEIGSGQTLIIDDAGLTLRGYADNVSPLVSVAGGTLELKAGMITGNTGFASGVNFGGGAFIMSGGSVTGNTGVFKDVFVQADGFFVLSGNAVIGGVVLLGADIPGFSMATSLTIGAGGWNGSATLDLLAIGDIDEGVLMDLDAVADFWIGRQIVTAAPGYTLTAADMAKFTLRNFVSLGIDMNTFEMTFDTGPIAPNVLSTAAPIGVLGL